MLTARSPRASSSSAAASRIALRAFSLRGRPRRGLGGCLAVMRGLPGAHRRLARPAAVCAEHRRTGRRCRGARSPAPRPGSARRRRARRDGQRDAGTRGRRPARAGCLCASAAHRTTPARAGRGRAGRAPCSIGDPIAASVIASGGQAGSIPPRSASSTPSLKASICAARLMLIASLSSRPCPFSPTCVTLRPELAQHRLDRCEGAVRAADHDRESAVLGRRDAAGDRRVDHGGTGAVHPPGQLAAGLRADRAHVHVDRPRAQPGQDPVRAGGDRRQGGVVGDHAEHHRPRAAAASRGVSRQISPCSISALALALVRLVPYTWLPGSRRPASGAPMDPRPTNPIFFMSAPQFAASISVMSWPVGGGR